MTRLSNDFVIKGVEGQTLTIVQAVTTPPDHAALLYVQKYTGGTPLRLVSASNDSVTASWVLVVPTPGRYQAQIWVEQDIPDPAPPLFTQQVFLALNGELESLPSARVAGSSVLSPAQAILNAINASILGQATDAQKMMIIGNMTVVNMSGLELLQYKRHFESEVAREIGKRSSKVKVYMS